MEEIKYTIVINDTVFNLIRAVNKMIDKGYSPHGSMVIYHNQYYQPMIKG